MEAEAYSNAPGLLRRGLSELLQHLLATFTTILQEQLPGELLVLPTRSLSSRSICMVQVLILATFTTTLQGQLPGGRPHFRKMPPLMASCLLGNHIMEQTLGCSLSASQQERGPQLTGKHCICKWLKACGPCRRR